MLAFAYALSWVFAIVGLMAPDAETAQAASFPLLAPLVFASSAFVPVESMPGWLQAFANHQPVSAVCNAARALTLGGPTTSYVLQALGWIIGIIAICAPIAVRRYRRAGLKRLARSGRPSSVEPVAVKCSPSSMCQSGWLRKRALMSTSVTFGHRSAAALSASFTASGCAG